MSTATVFDVGRPAATRRQSLWRYWRGGLRGSEFVWALAFLVPYIFVFFAFVVYPVCYGLWMGSSPALFAELFDDRAEDWVLALLLYDGRRLASRCRGRLRSAC